MTERLPEGVECALVFYMTCDEGLDAKLTVGGMSTFPGFLGTPDPNAMLSGLSAKMPSHGTNWRLMTREEIASYKAEENRP